jgi:hypothetical protein
MVSRPRPTVTLLRLSGALDLTSAPALDQHLVEQAATGPAHPRARPHRRAVPGRRGDRVDHGGPARAGPPRTGAPHGRVGNRLVERVLALTGVRSVLDVHDDLDALLAVLDA